VITWSFDADYFTACNCDWGCPCDFNAASTEGRCMGWGVWSIGKGRYGEAESELLGYPDGSVIRPVQELPHGIEFKRGLMTNAKRWWWHDDELLASYANKYCAVSRVKFTQEGCVA